jgi:hypothetical protein
VACTVGYKFFDKKNDEKKVNFFYVRNTIFNLSFCDAGADRHGGDGACNEKF